MGQTILCELITQWEESGEQPDVTRYEFADMLDVLVQARDVMLELGTQYNDLKTRMKIAEELIDCVTQSIKLVDEAQARMKRGPFKESELLTQARDIMRRLNGEEE